LYCPGQTTDTYPYPYPYLYPHPPLIKKIRRRKILAGAESLQRNSMTGNVGAQKKTTVFVPIALRTINRLFWNIGLFE
jgi:hypothetical protein